MKPTTILSAILGLVQTGTVSADIFTISKCICASDTKLGHHAAFHIKTTGFGDTAGRYNLSSEVFRDDFSYPKKEGLLCDSDSRSNCRRIPDISQYYNRDDMIPRRSGTNCFILDGKNICSSIYFLTINGVAKTLPDGFIKQIGNDECTERCAGLWPDDNSTMPLCEVTSLRNAKSKYYKQRVFAGNGFEVKDVDRCWTFLTPEFDFNKLGRP